MEVDTIIEGSLYAIHWKEDDHNSLDQMATLYNDAEYLFNYFQSNKEKLIFFQNPEHTPNEAASLTQKQANALIQELKKNCY